MTSPIRRMPALLSLLAAAALSAGTAAAQAGVARILEGRVIAADGAQTRGLRVLARAGALADSAEVDEEGRFALVAPDGADSLTVVIDAAEPSARAFQPARVVLGPGDLRRAQEIVLLPLRWTIRAGTYAGQSVKIDVTRAFDRPCESCAGFYRRSPVRAEGGRTVVAGWPAERFPLRVAFDREWSGVNVSPRDSAVFWREAQELEDAFGADIFRPVTFAEAAPQDDDRSEDVILVWFDPQMRGIVGLGSAISDGADIEYGDLRLDRAALSSGQALPGLVGHELMHTLGFGHTCAWRSVLADVKHCPELRAPTATPEDVAYVQLAARVRALQRERRGRWALEAAVAGAEMERAGGLAVR